MNNKMFENTLLIIKSDFMSGRKCLLLHLLSKGFQIQGSRKLAFTPEDAAEFYKDLSDDKCYMLYVILLSKGTSEAFILAKENAAEQLIDTMICYFGTSIEMDRNVHVSRNVRVARREITFIFPNYIHEPIDYFDKHRFSKQPVIAPLICEAYNIIKKPSDNQHENWRLQLSEWLLKVNPDYPEISNQCSHSPNIAAIEKYQQTNLTMMKSDEDGQLSMSSAPTPLGATSNIMSSSSCVSCSSFRSVDPCPNKAELDEFERRLKMRSIKTMKQPTSLMELAKTVCDDRTEWVDASEDSEASDILVPDTDKQELEDITIVKGDLPSSLSAAQEIMFEEEAPPQIAIIEEAPLPMALAEEHPPAEGEIAVFESKASEEEKEKEEPQKDVSEPIESAAEPAAVLDFDTETQPVVAPSEPEIQADEEPKVEAEAPAEE